MIISPQTSTGLKRGAWVGLALGVLSVIAFTSLVVMLALLFLDAAPGVVFFLEMLFYTSVGSAVNMGGFVGGMFAKNTSNTWMSIGVGTGIGAAVGLVSIIGIMLTLGTVFAAMGGAAGLAFVGMQTLITLVISTGIGSLVGGMMAKSLSATAVNDHPFSKESQETQQPTESNITSALHHGSQLRSSIEASPLEPLPSCSDLGSTPRPAPQTFKLLDSLRGIEHMEQRNGLEVVSSAESTKFDL